MTCKRCRLDHAARVMTHTYGALEVAATECAPGLVAHLTVHTGDAGPMYGPDWTITHEPTGYAVVSGIASLAYAQGLAEGLATVPSPLDWSVGLDGMTTEHMLRAEDAAELAALSS